jgi:isoleucyl-tRNA synthetase
VVQLGHSLRKQNTIKVRQPLARAVVISHDPAVAEAVRSHEDLIADELNVKNVEVRSEAGHLVELSCKADFKRLGPRLGPRMKEVAAAVANLTPDEIEGIVTGGTIGVGGEELTADDIIVQRTPHPGTVVESSGPLAVSLDVTIDEALAAEGVAREVISRLQQLRREAGLEVADRVNVRWNGSTAVADAIERHAAAIASEVLAETIEHGDDLELDLEVGGERLALEIERAGKA